MHNVQGVHGRAGGACAASILWNKTGVSVWMRISSRSAEALDKNKQLMVYDFFCEVKKKPKPKHSQQICSRCLNPLRKPQSHTVEIPPKMFQYLHSSTMGSSTLLFRFSFYSSSYSSSLCHFLFLSLEKQKLFLSLFFVPLVFEPSWGWSETSACAGFVNLCFTGLSCSATVQILLFFHFLNWDKLCRAGPAEVNSGESQGCGRRDVVEMVRSKLSAGPISLWPRISSLKVISCKAELLSVRHCSGSFCFFSPLLPPRHAPLSRQNATPSG